MLTYMLYDFEILWISMIRLIKGTIEDYTYKCVITHTFYALLKMIGLTPPIFFAVQT